MPSVSFFIHRRGDAERHLSLLAKGLKKVAVAGWAGGAGCSVMALLLGNFLMTTRGASNTTSGVHEISGITFVAWFMALALLSFSSLYFVAGWGLSHQKTWARYMAAATFLAKVLVCAWLGRGSLRSAIVFLLIASWDLYGLWVLLSKETAQLFISPQSRSVVSDNTIDLPI